MASSEHVPTDAVRTAVKGHETDVLDALDVGWRSARPHIQCPYRDHSDANPSWRWDEKKERAFCSCSRHADSIFDIVMKVEGLDFEAAKLRVAVILNRADLIRTQGPRPLAAPVAGPDQRRGGAGGCAAARRSR